MPDRYDTRWARPPQQQPWRPLLWGILLLLVAGASFAFRFELSSAARGLLALVPWSLGAAPVASAGAVTDEAETAGEAAEARRSGQSGRGRAARAAEQVDSEAQLADLLATGQLRVNASLVVPPAPDLLTLRKPIPFPGEVVEAMLSPPIQSFPPRLQNPDEVVELVHQHYPGRLREAGFGGRVVLALVIDATGSVRQQRVASPSNFSELNVAALEVGRRMEFSPARQLGRKVESELMFPVVFRP